MTPEQSAGLVIARVAALESSPVILAVDGPSAAGTSTLAAVLAEHLHAGVVRVDDFYRDMPEAQRWALSAEQGVQQYFDWQRLRHDALEPLKRGERARYQPYSWLPTGGLAPQHVTVANRPVIIVEGVYASRPELEDLIDLTVLVQTPRQERQRRLISRNHGNERWWPRWDAAETLYYTTVRPTHSFGLIVPGL